MSTLSSSACGQPQGPEACPLARFLNAQNGYAGRGARVDRDSYALAGGRYPGGRLLSRPSVEAMTTDQLTPAQKAISGLVPGFFDSRGWGFGVAVVTRRDDPAAPIGRYGWDGGMGTSWANDPREELAGILMTPCAWTSPSPPAICRDFWTLAYAAIDD